MKTWFTISELAAAQGVSRQCLIWYDRIGLFRPERVDPGNGYRYYSSDQLDALDTIMMMKATGMPLEQIRKELEDYSTSSSQRTLDESIVEIDRKISALKAVPGVNLGVTTFPAQGETYSVTPVLEHGKPFRDAGFMFETTGSTPLTEALLWATQELCRQPESRKILIVLTDGSPDNPVTCRQAIAEASRFVELYGLGIWDESIKKLLPDSSAIIYYLSDLSSALFNILQNTLIPRR